MLNVTNILNTTELDLETNITLAHVTRVLNISLSNLTHQSEETQQEFFNLYELYRTKEREQISAYKFVAYVVGTLIILSNLTVVISSGLILKKGQQPKSTYLLLGNVSLADTIIGISIIFGASVDNSTSSNPLCIFQIGMLVCPAIVSIFSVGMIAVDRYIYILHGLYYQRWFNTTKVRIGILGIWMIGITLGFMPATGWINKDNSYLRCYYTGIFPDFLILINSLLSLLPIVLVVILYSIILFKALQNLKNIEKAKAAKLNTVASKTRRNSDTKRLDEFYSMKKVNDNVSKLRRSISFNLGRDNKLCPNKNSDASLKSKSINDLSTECGNSNVEFSALKQGNGNHSASVSKYSLSTLDTTCTNRNSTHSVDSKYSANTKSLKTYYKMKEPKKLRAVIVVMLTSGSFVVSWTPFFITVIFYVFCEEKLINPKCIHMRSLLGGPLATMAFLNSIVNPLIYAWWHKGFQRSVRAYFVKCLYNQFRKDSHLSSTISK